MKCFRTVLLFLAGVPAVTAWAGHAAPLARVGESRRRLAPPRLDEARLATLEARVATLEATIAVMSGQAAQPPSGSDESGEYWLVDGSKIYKTSDGKAKGVMGFVNKPSGYEVDQSSAGALFGKALYVPAGIAILGLLLGGPIGDWLDSSGASTRAAHAWPSARSPALPLLAVGQPTIFSG